jgi:acyl carrier protein
MEENNMVFEKVVEMLKQHLDIDGDAITRDTTFESLGVDSLDTVEMVMDLEESLGIELELEGKVESVGQLVDIIEEKMG